jgi:hypothetical protein
LRYILFVLSLLVIGWASCSPSTTISPTVPYTPTEESGVVLSPTSIVPQSIKLHNPEILDEMPNNLSLAGTLLINGYNNNPSYFFNLEDRSTETIPDSFYGARVSSDGKILAYFEYEENSNGNWENLIITNDFGNKQIVPWKKEWFLESIGINGNLFIQNKRADSLPSFVLMNPKNNEIIMEIPPDFPDVETIYYAAEWWHPVYSPDGTKVVYPRVSQSSRIVLWDIEKQQVITTLSSINNPYGLEPVWSPSGSEFVMALENMYVENHDYPSHELFLASDSGQTKRLTYLSNFFDDSVRLGYYSWSPDNIHVAFQVIYDRSGQLATINTVTDELIIYRMPGDFVHHKPIWSPDGKFILIDGYFNDTLDHWTLLVDLDRNRIIKVAINSFPVGWVAFSQ